jgi:hypothetical protein
MVNSNNIENKVSDYKIIKVNLRPHTDSQEYIKFAKILAKNNITIQYTNSNSKNYIDDKVEGDLTTVDIEYRDTLGYQTKKGFENFKNTLESKGVKINTILKTREEIIAFLKEHGLDLDKEDEYHSSGNSYSGSFARLEDFHSRGPFGADFYNR